MSERDEIEVRRDEDGTLRGGGMTWSERDVVTKARELAGCMACSWETPDTVHKYCKACFTSLRLCDEIERLHAENVGLQAQVEKLRAQLPRGRRVEGFVFPPDVGLWEDYKAEARSCSMQLWTFVRHTSDVPAVLYIHDEGGGE